VVADGAAPRNRELVAEKSAATAGEDRGAAGEACPLLLASAGGRTSESAAVRGDAGSACAAADGLESGWPRQRQDLFTAGLGEGEVLQKRAGIRGHRAVLAWITDRWGCS